VSGSELGQNRACGEAFFVDDTRLCVMPTALDNGQRSPGGTPKIRWRYALVCKMGIETLGLIVVPALALLLYRVVELPEDIDEDAFGELSPSEPEEKTTPASQGDTVSYRDARPESVLSLAPLIALGVLGFALIFILSKQHR